MRPFADDHLPGLRVDPKMLPQPWVVPHGLDLMHARRIVAMLRTAIAHVRPETSVWHANWPERERVLRGDLRVPDDAIVLWHVSEHTGIEAGELLRPVPGSVAAVFHVAGPHDLPGLGWLAPLREAVLYGLLEWLRLRSPCAEIDDLPDHLIECSEALLSPIDLFDLARNVVQHCLSGTSYSKAIVEGKGDILARRFSVAHFGEGPSDRLVEALVAFAAEKDLDRHLPLLIRAGVLEADGRPLPLASWLRDSDVLQKALLGVLAPRPMSGELPLLWRAWFGVDRPSEAAPTGGPLDVEALEALVVRRGAMRTARVRLAEGKGDEAASLVLADMRGGRDSKWSPDERTLAATTLAAAGREVSAPPTADPSDVLRALEMLDRAGEQYEALDRPLDAVEAWLGGDGAAMRVQRAGLRTHLEDMQRRLDRVTHHTTESPVTPRAEALGVRAAIALATLQAYRYRWQEAVATLDALEAQARDAGPETYVDLLLARSIAHPPGAKDAEQKDLDVADAQIALLVPTVRLAPTARLDAVRALFSAQYDDVRASSQLQAAIQGLESIGDGTLIGPCFVTLYSEVSARGGAAAARRVFEVASARLAAVHDRRSLGRLRAAHIQRFEGDVRPLLELALADARATDSPAIEAEAYASLGMVTWSPDHVAMARTGFVSVGDARGVAACDLVMASLEMAGPNIRSAEQRLRRAERELRRQHARYMLATALTLRSELAMRRGNAHRASELASEARELAEHTENTIAKAVSERVLAGVARSASE